MVGIAREAAAQPLGAVVESRLKPKQRTGDRSDEQCSEDDQQTGTRPDGFSERGGHTVGDGQAADHQRHQPQNLSDGESGAFGKAVTYDDAQQTADDDGGDIDHRPGTHEHSRHSITDGSPTATSVVAVVARLVGRRGRPAGQRRGRP